MSEFSDNLPHCLITRCRIVRHKRGLVKYLPTKVDNIFVRCKFLWHEKALYTQNGTGPLFHHVLLFFIYH